MVQAQQRFRTRTTTPVFVPAVKLTVGRRALFLVAGARIWNDLPSDVTSLLPSLLKAVYI